MQLFNRELDIPEDAGFAEEIDIFGRKHTGERLAELLSALNEPTTLAIDGEWGTGKSVFLKMWRGLLTEKGFPVLYYNAFEDDHIGDAFLSLSAQVLNYGGLDEKKKSAKDYRKAASKIGSQIVKRGPRALIRIATAGVIDVGELEGASGEAIEIVSKEAEEVFDDLLQDYGKLADQRRRFSEALSHLAAELSPDRPLIFIIDELDRCRPSFSIDILEAVKHFFDTDGVHFVLGCNLKELAGSLKHVYGDELNSEEYLQKFVHLRITLPVSRANGNDDRQKYVGYLRNRSRLDIDYQFAEAMFGEVARIAMATDMSFRDIDRVCSYCALSAAYTPDNKFKQAHLLAGLCVLRVRRPELFAKARAGSLATDETVGPLGLGTHGEDYAHTVRKIYELWDWHCIGGGRKMQPEFTSWVARFDLEQKDALQFLANTIADAFMIFEPR